jgi:hypothetical protein
MHFTRNQREVIDLLLGGCKKSDLHEVLGCEEMAADRIIKELFAKLEVRNIDSLYRKLKHWKQDRKVKDIAKEQWEILYPDDSHSMTVEQIQIAWEHWLKAFQLAESVYKDRVIIIGNAVDENLQLTYSQIQGKKYNMAKSIENSIKKIGEEEWKKTATPEQINLWETYGVKYRAKKKKK